MSQSSQLPALIRTPRPSLTYRLISYLLVFPIYRLLFRGRTAGNGNVPRQGALVVVANHGSHLDPPLLGHALGRPVAFMAKAELFRVPILGAIIRACGAYPVSRGGGPSRRAPATGGDNQQPPGPGAWASGRTATAHSHPHWHANCTTRLTAESRPRRRHGRLSGPDQCFARPGADQRPPAGPAQPLRSRPLSTHTAARSPSPHTLRRPSG